MKSDLKMGESVMSKKNVSAVVSGAGLLTNVWAKLDRKVRELGGEDSDLHLLGTDDGEVVIDSMAQAIVDAGRFARNRIPLTIDYTKSWNQNVVDLNKIGIEVSDDFTEENFPLNGSGVVRVEATLCQFNDDPSREEMVRRMEKQGLEPGGPEHLMALAIQYPDKHYEGAFVSALRDQLPRKSIKPEGWWPGIPLFSKHGDVLHVEWNFDGYVSSIWLAIRKQKQDKRLTS